MASTTTPLPDLTAPPAAGQRIGHNGKEYVTVKEGLAHILLPAGAATVPQNDPSKETQQQSVFYNPIQQFNRDLTTLAIRAYGVDVVAAKQVLLNRKNKHLLEKRERKRKREDANNTGPRKAGKLTAASDPQNGTTQDVSEAEAPDANAMLVDDITKAGEVETVQPVAGVPESSETVSAAKKDEDGTEWLIKSTPQFTVLDALSATGLRALRYASEIPFVTSVTANDLLRAATDSIKVNVQHNRLESKININTGNAISHMYSVGLDTFDGNGNKGPNKRYDVIDLDPYGTAVPFLDGAVQAVRDGGLLCITCTDAGVWASNGYPEKCFSLYGGAPMKGIHSHEGGLRLILQSIAASAARYGLAIEPLLSLSIDFYARVFVRIVKSPADVKFLAGRTMLVYNCDQGCGTWTTQLLARNKESINKNGKGTFHKHIFAQAPTAQEHCPECGFKTHLAGPMYAGPLHNADFIQKILALLPTVSTDTYHTTGRIEGMLTTALEELLPPVDNVDEKIKEARKTAPPKLTRLPDPASIDPVPFFFIPHVLAKILHTQTPPDATFRGALKALGYRVTRSHAKGGSLKTDAPWSAVWHIMREWVKQKSPIREGALKKGTAGWQLLYGKDGTSAPKSSAATEQGSLEAESAEEKTNGDQTDGDKETNGGPSSPKPSVSPQPEQTTELPAQTYPELVFDHHLDRLGTERDEKRIKRFQMNPRENWGPMNRATGR